MAGRVRLGIGLAAAVLPDAFLLLLRTVLVPALMHLSGRASQERHRDYLIIEHIHPHAHPAHRRAAPPAAVSRSGEPVPFPEGPRGPG